MDAGAGADRHRYFEDLAVAHVLGGLDETEGRALRTHLLECADCRARVGELRTIAHELADVERAERRERAAQTLDTKRRQDEDDDLDDDGFDAPSRLSRVVVVGVLVLLLALAAWNFALRAQVTRLEEGLDALEFASETLQFGQEGPVRHEDEGVDGTVKVRDNQAVVLISGLESERLYGLHLVDRNDGEVYQTLVRAVEGRVFPAPIPLRQSAARVRLTTAPDGQAGQASGWVVFEADLPAPAPAE